MRKLHTICALAFCQAVSIGVAAPLPQAWKFPTPVKAGPAEVHVIGVYEGSYPPGVRHGFGFHPPGSVTVNVGELKKQVILVLTSYEPVVWNVSAPKGTVLKVIASGYHAQAVVGLDKSVPVTLVSHDAKDRDYFYARRKEAPPDAPDHEREETRQKYARLVERVKALTGMEIKSFQGAYAGSSFELR